MALERAEWGSRAFTEREMRHQLTDARSVVATLWRGPRLIGFAVAGPGWSRGDALLNNVLVEPPFRGRGLVWRMLGLLERELRVRGVRGVHIDARVDNGFADAVERHCRGRAEVIAPDHPSPYGPQRTIRVDLARPAPARSAPRRRRAK